MLHKLDLVFIVTEFLPNYNKMKQTFGAYLKSMLINLAL